MVILLYFYKCWISVNFDIQFIYISNEFIQDEAVVIFNMFLSHFDLSMPLLYYSGIIMM